MCGCGSTVPQVQVQPQQQVHDQSTAVTSLGSISAAPCPFNTDMLTDWQNKLNNIPVEKRVNHNIYMGYVLSGLADQQLICGSLFPMLNVINEHLSNVN